MKYNIGDIVKLRDDLEGNIRYGEIGYNKKMDRMKNKPIKLLRINHIYHNFYEVEDETGENWILSDEMIEGLWEECKSSEQVSKSEGKLKLIDVLNMIARGELKEGTKVKYKGAEFIYEDNELYDDDGDNICCYMCDRFDLTIEVELIEPDHFADVGKMAEPTKIEELEFNKLLTIEGNVISIINKLNEVIRYINKE